MNAEEVRTEKAQTGVEALPIVADLRRRLQGSLKQEAAARAEARRLARELALMRRLLRFTTDQTVPSATRPPKADKTVSRQRAVRLTTEGWFHLDACENQGAQTVIAGWAFYPGPEWDGRSARVTLLFKAGGATYAASASRAVRPDVAAYFAAQPAGVAGGAGGLDGAGFACEVLNDSLPAGVNLEITLRLECAGRAWELPTGQRLRL